MKKIKAALRKIDDRNSDLYEFAETALDAAKFVSKVYLSFVTQLHDVSQEIMDAYQAAHIEVTGQKGWSPKFLV